MAIRFVNCSAGIIQDAVAEIPGDGEREGDGEAVPPEGTAPGDSVIEAEADGMGEFGEPETLDDRPGVGLAPTVLLPQPARDRVSTAAMTKTIKNFFIFSSY